MFKNNCLRPPLLFVGIALAACFSVQGVQAATIVVGTCKAGIQFATIGAAITASPVGATINVCPGIYPEQVTINKDLTMKGIEVLYHDLDERPGAKFATADLIGIPYQVLVGPRGLAEGKVEVKKRADSSRENLSPAAALDLLSR